MHRYPALDELIGTQTWVKHENHRPICAFKARGGINLVSQLSEDERQRGVITASTGNHGQSIAYAAQLFGVRAIVCVPQGANPVKITSIRGFGAEIVTYGKDFDEAREHCEQLAAEHGYRYIHSGNEPRPPLCPRGCSAEGWVYPGERAVAIPSVAPSALVRTFTSSPPPVGSVPGVLIVTDAGGPQGIEPAIGQLAGGFVVVGLVQRDVAGVIGLV